MGTHAPTTPVWGTPLYVDVDDAIAHGDYATLVNDVALLYAKPWMLYRMVGGWQEINSSTGGVGNTVFNTGGTGSASYSFVQNNPHSGAGAYSYNSGGSGMFILPSLPGMYRVRAQAILYSATYNGFASARLSVRWYNSGSVAETKVGPWAAGAFGNAWGTGSAEAPTAEVWSQHPGSGSGFANVDSFSILCEGDTTGMAGRVTAQDPGSATDNPTSSPPYWYTEVFCEWSGSAGTF